MSEKTCGSGAEKEVWVKAVTLGIFLLPTVTEACQGVRWAKRSRWSERKIGAQEGNINQHVGLGIEKDLQRRRHGQREGGKSKDVVS